MTPVRDLKENVLEKCEINQGLRENWSFELAMFFLWRTHFRGCNVNLPGLMYQCPRTFFLERGVPWIMCPLNDDPSLTGSRERFAKVHIVLWKCSGTPRSETHRQSIFQSINQLWSDGDCPRCHAFILCDREAASTRPNRFRSQQRNRFSSTWS
jgi:hypothetical protein